MYFKCSTENNNKKINREYGIIKKGIYMLLSKL